MTNVYWNKFQDILREYAYKHSLYHYLYKLGVEVGESGQALPQAEIAKYLHKGKVDQVDYILSGLVRGHNEGMKLWKQRMIEQHNKTLETKKTTTLNHQIEQPNKSPDIDF